MIPLCDFVTQLNMRTLELMIESFPDIMQQTTSLRHFDIRADLGREHSTEA